MSKPIIVVFGATGAQGGSVARALLLDGKWKIRTLTRNANSAAAKELSSKGVEVLQGNQHSEEDVRKLMKDAHGVFLVTNFWDPETTGKEVEVGLKIATIAKEEGVEQFLYSSLVNCQKVSNGKYHVKHFTDKALLEEAIRKLGFKYTAFPAAAFYYSNFANIFTPKKDGENYSISLPSFPNNYITAFDVEDIGVVVLEILKNKEKYNGQFISIAGDHLHPQEYVELIAKKLGKPIKLNSIPLEIYAKLPFPGAEELADMFGWFNEYTYFGHNDWTVGKKISPKVKTFQQYLETATIPIKFPFLQMQRERKFQVSSCTFATAISSSSLP